MNAAQGLDLPVEGLRTPQACLGRRMAATTLNLLDHVVPPVGLRQFVLTVPHALRARLAYDGALMGAVSRIFVDSVLGKWAVIGLGSGRDPSETLCLGRVCATNPPATSSPPTRGTQRAFV